MNRFRTIWTLCALLALVGCLESNPQPFPEGNGGQGKEDPDDRADAAVAMDGGGHWMEEIHWPGADVAAQDAWSPPNGDCDGAARAVLVFDVDPASALLPPYAQYLLKPVTVPVPGPGDPEEDADAAFAGARQAAGAAMETGDWSAGEWEVREEGPFLAGDGEAEGVAAVVERGSGAVVLLLTAGGSLPQVPESFQPSTANAGAGALVVSAAYETIFPLESPMSGCAVDGETGLPIAPACFDAAMARERALETAAAGALVAAGPVSSLTVRVLPAFAGDEEGTGRWFVLLSGCLAQADPGCVGAACPPGYACDEMDGLCGPAATR